MAVTATELHWKGAVGSHGKDGREYIAVYRAYTDSSSDQSGVVLAYFASTASLPYINSSYSYGNDNDPTAFCDTVTPNRVDGIATVWEVVLHYKSASFTQENNVDANGNATNNPLDFRPIVRCNSATYQQAVLKAKHLFGFTGRALVLEPIGTILAPCNSAFDNYSDPPLERDRSRFVITITRNVATFDIRDVTELHLNRINSSQITINYLGVTGTIPKHCAKISSVSEDMRRDTISTRGGPVSIDYLEVTYDIMVDFEDWNQKPLDLGFEARAMPGDPDGLGGTIDQQSQDYPIKNPATGKAAIPMRRALRDIDDNPISNPVRLDGDGQPLEPGQTDVFIHWQVYEELDFSTVPHFSGILH